MRKFLVYIIFITCLIGSAFGQLPNQYGSISASSASCLSTNCVSIHFGGNYPSSVVVVTGTFSATLQFEASGDNGTTFVGVMGSTLPAGTMVSSTTGTGTFSFALPSITDFRVRASAYVSGTATVVIQPSPSNLAYGGSTTSAANASVSATGAAVPASATFVGGSDGTNLRAIKVASDGTVAVSGSNASVGTNGAAIPTSSAQAGGSDGTNLQPIAVDTSGRQKVIGPAATGAAVAGNPVYVGGSDGTNVEPVAMDTSGRVKVIGASASGAAVAGNPVLIAGSDGTNAITLPTTSVGIPILGSSSVPGNDATTRSIAQATTAGNGVVQMGPFGFNGTTWDKERTESASTQANANSIGVQLVQQSASIAVNSQPAVSTLGSASVAAGGAGVSHVADQVCFSGGSTTAPALTQLAINIRDGATGAGTVKASFIVIVPATTGQNVLPFCTGHLGILGTANTAMTAEWSALLTNEFEQVTLLYHNVN